MGSSSARVYYIENSAGQAVRALSWPGEKLNFVYRKDTKRIEATQDLSFYKLQGIEFELLETVDKSVFSKHSAHTLAGTDGKMRVVEEIQKIAGDVAAIEDNEEKFKSILKKTMSLGLVLLILGVGLSFILKSQDKTQPETQLEVVQVLDRKQIQTLVVPPSVQKKEIPRVVTASPKKIVHKKVGSQRLIPRQQPSTPQGALGILGSLKKSSQKGGLQVHQAQTSAGIGMGGSAGSGGVQTSISARGMFSAPLGSGNRADGAGGYGTKGKGGGRGGYGQVSLVGAGGSFFEPVESEAWFEGGLDRNEIAAVIQRHLSEVRFCYEQGLQKRPDLSGRLSMKFLIGPSGAVTTAQISNSSLRHPPVEDCIRNRLKTWKFPQPQGGVTVKVNYPFVLRRVSDT